MNLRELFPSGDQLKLLRGIEADLLKRRRKGMIGAIVGIAAAVLQVGLAVTKEGYIENIGTFLGKIVTGDFKGLIGPNGVPANVAIGMAVIILGVGIYFTLRWTSILAKESKEPFQYTFWVEPFEQVSGTPGNRFSLTSSDRLNLLHHDLMERLSRRITRLSLLNINSDVPAEARNKLTSHINVRGDYAVREVHDNQWVIHVMPTIRIGPPGHPETLADPVKVELSNGRHASHAQEFPADTYNHLIERVYSIVASEIYRQILSDVKNKSTLFPTSYLRAVALYYEAVDFERSNTIDAYDHAISLYRESKRYFDIRLMGALIRILARIPRLPFWRLARRALLADAKTRIGLTRSLIYRRIVSGLSGRNQNILFEIPDELNRVIANLTRIQNRETPRKWTVGQKRKAVTGIGKPRSLAKEERYRSLMGFLTFPFDSALRRGRHNFDQGREMLADAYAVAALAYHRLDAPDKAQRLLDSAKACNPDVNQKNHLWLLAAAEIETNINKKLLFLKQATELAPEFEIAQYRFAHFSEMRLRMRGEIRKERVERIIRLYEEVLAINPGNLGALLSQGYLYWLLRDWNMAERKFNQGCDTKTISRQIFIGEFQYGLARIAMEKGKLDSAYEFFDHAIAADPEVAAYAPILSRNLIHPSYAYITLDVLKQYQDFRRRAERTLNRHIKAAKAANQAMADSNRPLRNLHSFILNDYGNACLNYFHRFGDLKQLAQSIKAYEAAIEENDENFVAFYNLDNAYGWRNNLYGSEFPGQLTDLLEQAEKLAPAWPAVLIESKRKQLTTAQIGINKKRKEIADTEIDLDREVLRKKRSQTEPQAAPPTSIEVAQREGGTDGSSKSQNVGVKKSPGPKTTPAVSSQTTGKVSELFSRLDQLRKEVETSIDDVKKKLSPEITKGIMDGTKWSFLPPRVTGYQGERVDELLATRIERDRLDDSDIAALEVWATILSTNVESREALRAAEKLHSFVLSYYPQRFDSLRNLSTIYDALASLGSPLLTMEDLVDAEAIVQRLRNSSKPEIDCLRRRFTEERWALLEEFRELGFDEEFRRVLSDGLNELLKDHSLHKEECFSQLNVLSMRGSRKANSQNVNPIRINRNLLAGIFLPGELRIGKTPRDEVLESYQRDKTKCETSISKTIRNWLGEDPISFVYLKWATEFTDSLTRDEQMSFLKNAAKKMVHDREQNGAYYYLLGKFSLKQSLDPALQDRRNEELEESAKCFEEANRLSPGQPLYLNSLGNSRYWLSQYREASASYEKAVELDPKNSFYHANLADALQEQKEWERALAATKPLKELENKLYIEKSAGIYNTRGNHYYSNGDYASALKDYEKAVERDPKTAVYYANVAVAFTGLKKWKRALTAIEKVKDLDSAAMYAQSSAMVYNARGNDYYGKGDYASAIKDYEKAVELVPKTAVSRCNIAAAFAGLKKWDRALAAIEKAKELDNRLYSEQLAIIYNIRGNDYYGNRDDASALKDYEKAVELDPKTAVYHANVATALTGLKKWEHAFAIIEKAKELDNSLYTEKLAAIYNARGNDYYGNGDNARALKDYEKAVELDPKTAIYHANVAIALTGLKKWELALEVIKKAKELDEGLYTEKLAAIYNARGNDYYGNGDYASALKDYEKAVELDPRTAVYHANVAAAFVGLKEWERALVAIEKAKELDHDLYTEKLAIIYNIRGNDYYGNGDYASALKDYEKAVGLDPRTAVYHANVAATFAGLKEWERALAASEKAKELDNTYAPMQAGIYNAKGTQYYAKGDYASSLKDYQKAVEFDDTSALYHLNLGCALRELGEWERAISECTKAIELEPTNANNHRELKLVYNAYGIELLNKGEYKQAIKKFQEAIEAQDGDDIVYCNLGIAWADVHEPGAIENAVKAVQEAIRLNPTNDEHKKVLSQIESHDGSSVRNA